MHAGSNIRQSSLVQAIKASAFRLGMFIGLMEAAVFIAWLIVANRMPALESLALERNILLLGALLLLALVPVLRYIRRPGALLGAGLISWSVFSFVYRILCLFFPGLPDWHTTFQVLMLGVLGYLLAATVAWIGTLLWRVRASHTAESQKRLT